MISSTATSAAVIRAEPRRLSIASRRFPFLCRPPGHNVSGRYFAARRRSLRHPAGRGILSEIVYTLSCARRENSVELCYSL